MGKYSLENHERYRSVKIRPPRLAAYQPVAWDGAAVVLDDREALARARASGMPFALVIRVGGEPLAETGRRLAQASLQTHWRVGPVFVDWAADHDRFTSPEFVEHVRQEAVRWHAAACCGMSGFGSRVELRKIAWAREATAGGLLPVRLWWVSSGTSPVYGAHPIRLRISNGQASHVIPLAEDIGRFLEGDDTTNRMLRLPAVQPGRYVVSIAASGYRLAIGDIGLGPPDGDGFVPLGHVELDLEPRPWMRDIWKTYYPEGYYPLEDPEVPA